VHGIFFNRRKFSGLKFDFINDTRSSADFTRRSAAAATWKSNKTLTPKKQEAVFWLLLSRGRG
jgi:hypothetical protein